MDSRTKEIQYQAAMAIHDKKTKRKRNLKKHGQGKNSRSEEDLSSDSQVSESEA